MTNNNSSSYHNSNDAEEMKRVDEMIQKLAQMSGSAKESGGYGDQTSWKSPRSSNKSPPETILIKQMSGDQQTVSTEESSSLNTEQDHTGNIAESYISKQQEQSSLLYQSPYQRAQEMAQGGISENALEESKLQADMAEKQALMMQEAVAASSMDRHGENSTIYAASTTCVEALLKCLSDPVSTNGGSFRRGGYESMTGAQEEMQHIRIPDYSSHGPETDRNSGAYTEI